MDLKDHIRGIPDFPKPGILFYDISTLLRDADAWQVAMGRMAKAVRAYQPDLLAGIESRGFLIAAPLALLPSSDTHEGRREHDPQDHIARRSVSAGALRRSRRRRTCDRGIGPQHAGRTRDAI